MDNSIFRNPELLGFFDGLDSMEERGRPVRSAARMGVVGATGTVIGNFGGLR